MGKPDGGPAFPVLGRIPGNVADEGMRLRDWFAGQALNGLSLDVVDRLVNPEGSDPLHDEVDDGNRYVVPAAEIARRLVRACYVLADAMLAEREK